jgi:cytidylate kinase
VVTIDGPGGVGKSTVAKLLAKRLGALYLDTGATYRVLAHAALTQHALGDAQKLAALARRLPLRMEPLAGGGLRVWLNGQDVTDAIRTEKVSEAAAVVAQNSAVRSALVQLQRRLARAGAVVVEGRDTGSVVFPRATHKFFLDADPDVRARRRQRELQKRYGAGVSLTEVREQLEVRDELDRSRRVGPLVKPKGAIAIDTSRVTAPQVVRSMLRHIHRPL